MNDALTLGVIGHVDHGKTALVRAVTGIETDRLKEERERGLSIVLGFAFIETKHGVVDLIDVPGHEDFIRAMVGGATALDGVVLCVAANEGVMPQTVEHLNIAGLLGVERGFAVLTKTDLVDEEELALAREDLDEFISGSFLDGAKVVEVSAAQGVGIDAVRDALEQMAETPVEREVSGRFFMPLDRTFTMRGFGQVVTGTLRGGELAVGDAVEIMPGGQRATIRGLQNHNRPVERVVPGQRVAVNLRHVDRDEVHRGDVVASPGSVTPTQCLDVELRLLDDVPGAVKNGTTVRLLTGTTEAMAKLRLLDRRELAPGETSMAQLNLDRPIATRSSEHFLIRSFSPMYTIGGGRILDVNAKRHRRYDQAVTKRLETVATGKLELIVRQRLDQQGALGVRPADLALELGASVDEIESGLAAIGVVEINDDLVVAASAYDALLNDIVASLEAFHQNEPLKKGIDIGSLATKFGDAEIVRHAVKRLVEQERVSMTNEVLSLYGHDPFATLGDREKKAALEIERAVLTAGLEWMAPDVVTGADNAKRAAFELLIETGRLVRLRVRDRGAQMIVHADAVSQAKQAIEQNFPNPASFALKDIRDLLGSTRKYVVPFMEHLDATGFTVRSGDLRRLREQ